MHGDTISWLDRSTCGVSSTTNTEGSDKEASLPPQSIQSFSYLPDLIGEQYGYSDDPQHDGSFWYTGEGQTGDMEFKRGNKAIAEHSQNGKALHLFQNIENGWVRYIGEFRCAGFHRQKALDKDGKQRFSAQAGTMTKLVSWRESLPFPPRNANRLFSAKMLSSIYPAAAPTPGW